MDIRCRRLEQLLLGSLDEGGLGCAALRHVVLASDRLYHLTWRQFPGLELLDLDCPHLTELNLHDCDSLQVLVIRSLLLLYIVYTECNMYTVYCIGQADVAVV